LAFELRTRESELNQYRLLVNNTKRLVESLNIKAPVSGIVGSWSVEQKSAVSLNQPLLTIVDLSAFQVEIDIPESYADVLGLGMPVKVHYNRKEYDASVVSISPEVVNNIVKGRVAFTAEPPPGIKQNQKVTSQVILERKNDVLYVPRGSFVQHHAGMKAFVVEGNTATLTEIKLGARSLDKIEIITGLKQGQKIIISNTDFVNKAKVLSLN
jgi:HlyD family secretion protein